MTKEIHEEAIVEKVGKKEKKALFLQRLVAFFIDVILISVLASLLTTPFVDTEKTTQLEEKVVEILEQYRNEEITSEEYMNQYFNTYYQMVRLSGITTVVTLLLNVCYFVVYQTYTKGQTFGKKLMKIRVVSDQGELSYNQMIFRSFLANSILVDLILFVFLLFGKKNIYFYVVLIFEGLQYLMMLMSVLMVSNSKNGRAIHDKIAHTRVLREN